MEPRKRKPDGPWEKYIPDSYNLHKKQKVSEACNHGLVEYCYPRYGVDTGIVEFNVEGNSEHCIVSNQIRVKIGVEISGSVTKTTGNGVKSTVKLGQDGADIKIFAVNNILHTAFESVEVYVGNQATTKTDKHNPYIAYFDTLCNYGEEAHNTYFQLGGWSKDTAGAMKSLDTNQNKGLIARKGFFTGKETLRGEFIGRLCSPLFMQDNILPTQISLRIVMKQANDKFCLMHDADGDFHLRITDAVLMVPKVSVASAIKESYVELLEQGHPMQYFLHRPSVNYYTIEKGSSQFVRDDLFLGKMPRRIIIGMVETAAYHGSGALNPFNFEDFGVISVGLYKDGMPYPYPQLNLDISQNMYAEAYYNFVKSLGAANTNKVPAITKEEFAKGFTLFSYNMSPDQMESTHPATLTDMNSNIRLEMKFKTAMTENVTVLVYSEMESLMEIYKDRKVVVNF